MRAAISDPHHSPRSNQCQDSGAHQSLFTVIIKIYQVHTYILLTTFFFNENDEDLFLLNNTSKTSLIVFTDLSHLFPVFAQHSSTWIIT